MTYREAGEGAGYSEATAKTYMSNCIPFRTYVDKCTIENEMTSRGGLLRRLMNGAEKKEDNIKDDKSSYLDYLKFINQLANNAGDKDTEVVIKFR